MAQAPQFGYDVSAYWLAGQHLLEGQPIYTAEQLAGPYPPQGQYLYLYPPFLAVLFMPLAAMFPDSYDPVAWLWAGFGAALLAVVVVWVAGAERIVADGRHRSLLLAAAFAFPPVVGELVLGNVHLQLVALFALAWWGVRRDDRLGLIVAGVAIGAAGLIKVLPFLVIVWFVASGRWRGAVWAVIGALALIALLSVSTAARWRMMAFLLSIRRTPRDSTAVTTAGRPSGTAATASATPRMSTSKRAEKPLTSSTRLIITIITTAMTTTISPSSLPTRSSSFWSGVVSSGASFSMPAMRPISVCIAVAVTTARPRP